MAHPHVHSASWVRSLTLSLWAKKAASVSLQNKAHFLLDESFVHLRAKTALIPSLWWCSSECLITQSQGLQDWEGLILRPECFVGSRHFKNCSQCFIVASYGTKSLWAITWQWSYQCEQYVQSSSEVRVCVVVFHILYMTTTYCHPVAYRLAVSVWCTRSVSQLNMYLYLATVY